MPSIISHTLRMISYFVMVPCSPHHFGERRVKQSMKLLLMVHHDFVSVFYTYYQWFTRPQRVVLLLCTVVTLMAADATVFATIMFNVR